MPRRADASALSPGASVGPYRLESLLGVGAMGAVHKARREPDGTVVALKLMRPELMHDALSLTLNDAIQRHAGVGGTASRNAFNALSAATRADVFAFLNSL